MNLPDPRNRDIVIFVDGHLLPRDNAKVSVFDSVVQGGDAVWEGLRVYKGRIAALEEHLERLQDSAKTLAFSAVPSSDEIRNAIFQTLEANGMSDEAHIRLTLTRGEKITSRTCGVEAACLLRLRNTGYHSLYTTQHASMSRLQNSSQQLAQ